MNDVDTLTDLYFAALDNRPDAYLVGIAGVPGSGKTTLCRAIAARRPDAVIVPMDGYHLQRSRLDAEGMRRRGACTRSMARRSVPIWNRCGELAAASFRLSITPRKIRGPVRCASRPMCRW